MSLPELFKQTSDLPYDRHNYRVYTKMGKTYIFDDYEMVRAFWFQSKKLLSHVEVLDIQKGFKEKTNERKSRKN